MTLNQILKLRPEFKIGFLSMVEWFEVTQSGDYCFIKSGLNHADGKTKSPYYYDDFVYGKNARKKCVKRFNEWWDKKMEETKSIQNEEI